MAPISKMNLSLLGLMVLGLLSTTAPAQAEGVLVAHPSIQVESIDSGAVRNLFLGKTTKLGDARVVIVAQSQGATHESFLKEYVGKSPKQFLNFWRKLAFTGKASLPTTLDSDEAVVDWVSHNEGAVGYIADASGIQGVTVIRIQ